jgi:hypothetical protein
MPGSRLCRYLFLPEVVATQIDGRTQTEARHQQRYRLALGRNPRSRKGRQTRQAATTARSRKGVGRLHQVGMLLIVAERVIVGMSAPLRQLFRGVGGSGRSRSMRGLGDAPCQGLTEGSQVVAERQGGREAGQDCCWTRQQGGRDVAGASRGRRRRLRERHGLERFSRTLPLQ